jgi:hypothetical protein
MLSTLTSYVKLEVILLVYSAATLQTPECRLYKPTLSWRTESCRCTHTNRTVPFPKTPSVSPKPPPPKENLYMQMRDVLGSIYEDED